MLPQVEVTCNWKSLVLSFCDVILMRKVKSTDSTETQHFKKHRDSLSNIIEENEMHLRKKNLPLVLALIKICNSASFVMFNDSL